jgi:hypothetical protein
MGAELLASGGRCVAVPLCSGAVESGRVDSCGLAHGFLRSVLGAPLPTSRQAPGDL